MEFFAVIDTKRDRVVPVPYTEQRFKALRKFEHFAKSASYVPADERNPVEGFVDSDAFKQAEVDLARLRSGSPLIVHEAPMIEEISQPEPEEVVGEFEVEGFQTPEEFEGKNKKEVIEIAKDLGVEFNVRDKKDAIIEAIINR